MSTKRIIHTRTANPSEVDATPARIEAADGGVYVRVGDVEIAVTSADTDDDTKTTASLARARKVIEALIQAAPDALAEIDEALADIARRQAVAV